VPPELQYIVHDHCNYAFVGLWFVMAGEKIWIGILRAGYSFREELPVFSSIILLPVMVAVAFNWKFL